jgi:ABC-2 type transport system ATP-binding protein
MPALEVRSVTKVYDQKVAVEKVSLGVEPGEIFGLLGPNGAGKSSLLRMAMDIIRPDSGEILVFGSALTPRSKERIGYLPEERGLYQRQRVGEILQFLGELRGLSGHVAGRRVDSYLDRVGLIEVKRKRMRELSKGMQQKVQIAAVLLGEPELLILDEPFEGLDPVNQILISDLMKEFTARGAAIVLSSHRMDQVEAMCRRVLLLHHGQCVLSGEVQEIKERFSDNAVLVEADRDLRQHPAVERTEPHLRGLKLWLRTGTGPEAFMADLLSQGARIRHFERAQPSLDEIFVKVVRR